MELPAVISCCKAGIMERAAAVATYALIKKNCDLKRPAFSSMSFPRVSRQQTFTPGIPGQPFRIG